MNLFLRLMYILGWDFIHTCSGFMICRFFHMLSCRFFGNRRGHEPGHLVTTENLVDGIVLNAEQAYFFRKQTWAMKSSYGLGLRI